MILKKSITVCGILTACIWFAVTLITRGIPLWACEKLGRILPFFVRDEISKMANGFYYEIANKDMPQAVFILLFISAFIIYIGLIVVLRRHSASHTGIIILFAIIFRLILIPSVLIHENDIYRYIWDGKVLLSGINPYKYPPEEARILYTQSHTPGTNQEELKQLRLLKEENRTFFYRIGHRDVPTIYPPLAQGLFALSDIIKRDSIILMKSIFVIFDILAIFIIYEILVLLRLNTNMLIVYAWSPLVLKEFANSGHLDSISIFFILCALLFALQRKKILSAASLSSGILSKLFPCVTLPLFFKRSGLRYVGGVLALGVIGYIPFLLMGKISSFMPFEGLFIYGRKWAINGGIFETLYSIISTVNLKTALSSEMVTKIILSASYLVVLFFILRRRITDDRDFMHRAFLSIAFLFLLSPVGDPWYFCWVIPFLCFFPYYSFIILSCLLIFSYISFVYDLGSLRVGHFAIDRLIVIQYLPFFILLFAEMLCIKIKRSLS